MQRWKTFPPGNLILQLMDTVRSLLRHLLVDLQQKSIVPGVCHSKQIESDDKPQRAHNC